MKIFISPFVLFMVSMAAIAQTPVTQWTLKPGELQIKPSFEACSYYFYPEGTLDIEYKVQFRRKGEQNWRPAFKAIRDLPSGVWKGSILDLEEDTEWQLRVLSGRDSRVIMQSDFRTWSSNLPIAKVIDYHDHHFRCTFDSSNLPIAKVIDLSKLAAKNEKGIVISMKGKPDGWIKYTAPPGWILKRPYSVKDLPSLININYAQYVILENITIEGGRNNGIGINDSKFIRIINCDISGWGRTGKQEFRMNTDQNTYYPGRDIIGKYVDADGEVINYDAGIGVYHSSGTVIERCYIHDPRGRANSWMFSHPAGPSAVYVNNTKGGNVVRWNDLIGSDEHRWNDVIESGENDSPIGGFYRDSDIYGNYFAFGNDDGIELEGGGMNVRFYRNKIEGTLCGISTGACLLGPQIVYGNLITNLGDESGLSLLFFKNNIGFPQGGMRYFINNTLYGFNTGLISGYGKPLPNRQMGFMRNNIFLGGVINTPSWAKLDDFDHDLFWIENNSEASRNTLSAFREAGQEAHGMVGNPQLIAPTKGNYRLSSNSMAAGNSVAVNNVIKAGDDMGAYYNGIAELPFRPLALTAMPQQLNFLPGDEMMPAEITLTLPASETNPTKFEVRKNKVFDWFTASPSSGEIKPGESLKITVKVDPSKLHGRPLFRGAFIIRTPAGLSCPVSVYAKGEFKEGLTPSAAPNTIYMEAASFPGAKELVKTTSDPAVSEGKYVALDPSLKEPEMTKEFNIKEAGGYSLLLRTGISGNTDVRQFELTLDGTKKKVAFETYYQWHTADRQFKVIYLEPLGNLSAGKHTITLKLTKGKINLNQIIITDKPGVFFEQYWQSDKDE